MTEKRELSRWRRAAYGAIFALLLVVPVELASLVMLRVVDGRGFSPRRYAAERLALREEKVASPRPTDEAIVAPRSTRDQVLHPFLGFVYDRDSKAVLWGKEGSGPVITDLGFLRPRGRTERAGKPSDFRVGIFGGSVAMFFSIVGRDDLARGLEASPALAGRRVRVVSCAIAGYKQPQQLAALAYLLAFGERFDVVVNLDGFNELTLPVIENIPRKTHPLFPRLWDIRVSGVTDLAALEKIGELAHARRQRRETAESFVPVALAWSPTWNLLWRMRDRGLAARADELEREVAGTGSKGADFQSRGPRWQGGEGVQVLEKMAEQWARSSLLMHRLAAANGIRYFHLLQPNQYVPGSKPLSSEERSRFFNPESPYRPVVEAGYAGLQRQGQQLAGSGVRFLDLSGVFRNEAETIYTDDCCHFGRRGNEIVAARLVAAIRADLERD